MPDLLERLTAAFADRYAIECEAGRGGMAVVFKAEDLRHHRQVAIKVLHPELAATLGAERFLHEIEIVAGLQHPHILPLYESGEADGLLYYVMPFAEGESLRQRLDREKQLAVDESVRIAVEVADGLDYAHRKGVVHRDIKPGNILLSERHAVIADFGIARAIEAAQAERVTSTGLGVGTPLYASPEQATAQETLDGRTDIYSLGCVLYEMLAGEPPLTGATPLIIQARRVSETPSALHALRDTVPPALDHVIARALARIPADRYATAAQFGQALQAVLFAATPATMADLAATPAFFPHLSETPASVTAPPGVEVAGPKKRRPIWLPVAVAMGAVAVAGTWFLIRNQAEPDVADPAEDGVGHVQLPHTGNINSVAISRDGQRLALCDVTNDGTARVRVGSIAAADTARTLAVVDNCYNIVWVQDDAAIVFQGSMMGRYGTYRISPEGGSPSRSPCYGILSFSPDGERCSSSRNPWKWILVGPSNSPSFRSEADSIPITGEYEWIISLSWSPTGDLIAVVTQESGGASSVWTVEPDGSDQTLAAREQQNIGLNTGWATDGSALYYFRGSVEGADLMRVSRSGASDGEPQRLWSTPHPFSPYSPSVSTSGDGRTMVTTLAETQSRVVRVIRGQSPAATMNEPVTEWSSSGGFCASKDGQWIAYDKSGPEGSGLFRKSVTGGAERRITSASGLMHYRWSPDGRFIAFVSPWRDTTRLWLVASQGGDPAMVRDIVVGQAGIAWEGERLFSSDTNHRNFTVLENLRLFSMDQESYLPIDSVSPEEALPTRGVIGDFRPLVANDSIGWMLNLLPSPDGSQAVVRWNRPPTQSYWLLSLPDSSQTWLPGAGDLVGWTDDGAALYWLKDSSIYLRSLDGEEQLWLTLPETEDESALSSCEPRRGTAGEEFLCYEEVSESDAWLIENFDPHVN